MDNNVQLKEEELVGQEVVLQDIYPKTDTESVTDVAYGTQMNVTLDRLWEAINHKLTRVVNSVNGRTGVVALDASDVGLSNVDNVSFGDIKQWVIDQLEAEFAGHRVVLFNSLNDVNNTIISPNDRSYENRPFYAFTGIQNESLGIADNRSYIGYAIYNSTTGQMEARWKPINVVGSTDESLLYSTDEETGGLLKVHIHKDEKALYLEKGSSIETSGLRIDPSFLGGKTWVFFGAYYRAAQDYVLPDNVIGYPEERYPFPNGSKQAWATGFLDSEGASSASARLVHIFINGENFGYHRTVMAYTDTFQEGDSILCYFNPYIDINTGNVFSDSMYSNNLMFRQPAMGYVKYNSEDTADLSKPVMELHFRSLVSLTGYGIINAGTRRNASNKATDSVLELEFPLTNAGDMASPINVISRPDQYTIHTASTHPEPDIPNGYMKYVITPSGRDVLYSTADSRRGGIFVQTDFSLCVMPNNKFGMDGSIDNWYAATPVQRQFDNHDGYLNPATYLGINLSKGIVDHKYIPLSGLKVLDSQERGEFNLHRNPKSGATGDYDWLTTLGFDDSIGDENPDKDRFTYDFDEIDYSGGLMVNVGKFLEIYSI